MPPRVLLLLSQMPQDPGSGAARSMRTICEFLAAAGMEVAALATTSTEAITGLAAVDFLKPFASSVRVDIPDGYPSSQVIRFTAQNVHYHLLQTDGLSPAGWEPSLGTVFDAFFEKSLAQFRPDVLFTFGGSPAERARRTRAKRAGCKVVFGLRNLAYLSPAAFDDIDAVLAGSQFLSDRYRSALGIHSTPLPLPLQATDVIAPSRERIFITYVNPSIEKGVFFAARLFEELAARRPDIPVLIIESRGTGGTLVAAGLAGSPAGPGFDLRRHSSIMLGHAVSRPADIFSLARVIVMPSIWEEPAGRVAAEALANGIPPVVSDRGGLPEVCGEGGFVLPLPASVIESPCAPVPASAVEGWLHLLTRLVDDDPFYDQACRRAETAAAAFDPESLIPLYSKFFLSVLNSQANSPRT